MPDVLFETMITAGLVVLLWRTGGQRAAGGGGGAGAGRRRHRAGDRRGADRARRGLRRADRAPGWRRRAGRAALAAGCFALPVLGYMTGTFVVAGHFGLASNGPGPEYGRAAAAADCATLVVPADERALCPSPAQTLALGGIDGLLHSPGSPGHTVPVPPGCHPRAAARPVLAGRVPAAAAAGGRVGGPGLGPAVRADPGRQPAGHPDHALAVPGLLPDLPAPVLDGLPHPAGARARQRRRPGRGPARRLLPAGLPAGRRLHARPAVRGLPGRGGGSAR